MITTSRRTVSVIGAGGHAKVVITTLRAAGFCVSGLFDDDRAKWGQSLLGIPVVGAISELADQGRHQAVIAIGDNAVREQIARRLEGMDWLTVMHPGSFVDHTVRLGRGTVVFAGAVIQAEAAVGAHVIVNTAATIDHDCVVGDYAHLGPGVHLAGSVRVERGVLMGIGSTVVPGCCVGEWAIVGAGGVVISDLRPRVVAVGVPARPSKQEER